MAEAHELVGWLDPELDFEDWVDRPEEPLFSLLLLAAWEKLIEWAPKPLPAGTVDDPVPARYKLAQRLLTQHLAARKNAGDGNGFGADGYMIQTYPLVREAYDAIRPKRSNFAGLL